MFVSFLIWEAQEVDIVEDGSINLSQRYVDPLGARKISNHMNQPLNYFFDSYHFLIP
jgi:hypothetical protein